jgi:Tfp pilus assembly protein PilF
VVKAQWSAARANVMGGLARDQFESGNFEKSRTTVDDAMRLDPKNPGLHLLSARLALEAGQLELAEAELRSTRELDAKNAEADYLSGIVAQRWQKIDAAKEFYHSAAQKQPGELAYVLAEAEMLVALGRSNDALTLLTDKIDNFEHSAPLRDAIGQLLVQQSRWTDAADNFRDALILDSKDNTIREHLGLALYMAGNFREASDHLGTLLKDPAYEKRTDILTALGQCQMQNGKLREAKACFETVVQLNAAAADSWMNLTKVSMSLGDLPRADLALRKAMTIDPSSSDSHLLLGYLRLKQKRLPEALAAFEKAHELASDDGVSLCMIGYVLEKSGQSNRAIDYYAQALRLKPNDELATRLMARVESRE